MPNPRAHGWPLVCYGQDQVVAHSLADRCRVGEDMAWMGPMATRPTRDV